VDFLFGVYLLNSVLNHATNHTHQRCVSYGKTSRTNSTFGFLPSHKPTLKKPKELFSSNALIEIEKKKLN